MCLMLVLMINVNYFDVRCIFVSLLCLDVFKIKVVMFNVFKEVGMFMFGMGVIG